MVTEKNFPGGPRRHLGGAPAAPHENLDFSKKIQNVSYDTILKNIDQMWHFGEKIIKIGSFLTKLWMFEAKRRHDVITRTIFCLRRWSRRHRRIFSNFGSWIDIVLKKSQMKNELFISYISEVIGPEKSAGHFDPSSVLRCLRKPGLSRINQFPV